MAFKTITLLLSLLCLSSNAWSQEKGYRGMVSIGYRPDLDRYRINKGYGPLIMKLGYDIVNVEKFRVYPYVSSEFNSYGISAYGLGAKMTYREYYLKRRVYFVLDTEIKGIYPTTYPPLYGSSHDFGKFSTRLAMGYRLSKLHLIEAGVTLNELPPNIHKDFLYAFELNYIFHPNWNKKNKYIKVPDRYKKPKNQLKCPYIRFTLSCSKVILPSSEYSLSTIGLAGS